MAELSRRHLVASGLAAAGATLLPGTVKQANAATAVRYNLATPQGQAMLKKYAEAVKLMMALPASDPRSWTFQWYTHWVPTNTTKAAQLDAVFGPNPSPQKTLANDMWNTCGGHFVPANEPYFLPWHRMYVCYFEEIIRSVLKDPQFTLPYWNYSVPAGYALPKEFRLQNDPVWGSLYRPDRNPTSNAGQPIYVSFNGSPSDLSPTPALSQTTYLPNGAVNGFNLTLDSGLHGNVHVFVGNRQGMGQVPWAAFDPIFWMHHCNIDRIWMSWNLHHPNPGTTAWLDKTFIFAGPDGKAVKAVVKDYTNTKKCDYRYDELLGERNAIAVLTGAAAPAAAELPPAPANPVTVAKTQGGPVALGSAPTRIAVQAAAPSPTGAARPGSPLSASLSALPEKHRIYLVISDFKASAPPEAIYRVYLDLPDNPPTDPVNSNYVGSFNFFAAVPHGDDHEHGDTSREISFDITDIAAGLDARSLLKAEHAVTIVPSNAPAENSKPVVGSISFVEQ